MDWLKWGSFIKKVLQTEDALSTFLAEERTETGDNTLFKAGTVVLVVVN